MMEIVGNEVKWSEINCNEGKRIQEKRGRGGGKGKGEEEEEEEEEEDEGNAGGMRMQGDRVGAGKNEQILQSGKRRRKKKMLMNARQGR